MPASSVTLCPMQPIVEAAWIAAVGATLSVIGTVTVAVSGFRNTHKITDQTIQAAAQESIRARDAAHAERLWERKAAAYSAFLTQARAYRNALRPFEESLNPKPPLSDLDGLAVATNNAASLVFIVLESQETYDTCRSIIRAISTAQSTLSKADAAPSKNQAGKINSHMAQVLRNFQVAVRNELAVRGVDPSLIQTRHEAATKDLLKE